MGLPHRILAFSDANSDLYVTPVLKHNVVRGAAPHTCCASSVPSPALVSGFRVVTCLAWTPFPLKCWGSRRLLERPLGAWVAVFVRAGEAALHGGLLFVERCHGHVIPV
jgi:hypothetical protein